MATKQDPKELARLKAMVAKVRTTPLLGSDDRLDAARRRIENSTWNFDRPSIKDSNRMTFLRGGVWQTTVPQKGFWVMATEHIAVASYRNDKSSRDELFLFEFDENFDSYKVKAFGDIPTKFVAGQRIK